VQQAPFAQSYDDIPYPRLSFSYTHPGHLAAVGRLMGLRPAAVERCGVLELGCAGGGNLVPMAYAIPESLFVGIDLSERQIIDARAFADAVGLTNITLEPMNILDAAEPLLARFGEFDYIIAHGIYSWVPDAVKEALLAACRRLLAPQGIAYVSFSCYPGGELREMIRRMCKYHGRNERDPQQFAAKTREFLEVLLGMHPNAEDAYSAAVGEQAANLLAQSDSVLLHDALESDNDPQLFARFLADAARHGLQYCGDAHFSHMLGIGVDAAGLAEIRRDALPIDVQQRLDFLYGRTLRATLLCRKEIEIRHELVPSAVRNLCVASSAIVLSPDGHRLSTDELARVDIDGPAVKFSADECSTTIAGRVGKAAMLELCAANPQPMRFDELVERVERRLDSHSPLADQLSQTVIRWFATRLAELTAFDPPIATSVSDRPLASAVARDQVASGRSASDSVREDAEIGGETVGAQPGQYVTNLLHRRTYLGGELVSQVLSQLDGQHDRQSIVEPLAAAVFRGEAEIHADGERIIEPNEVSQFIADRVDGCIAELSRNALLVKTTA
jgi:SAM-dependent methyltransferase/methyltransferase-like protein